MAEPPDVAGGALDRGGPRRGRRPDRPVTARAVYSRSPLTNRDFLRLLAPGGLIVRFQPIVAAPRQGRRIRAVECLTHGVASSGYADAGVLFAEARYRGLEAEIDRACVSTMFDALARRPVPFDLFLNVHPETLRRDGGFAGFLALAAQRATVASSRLTVELLEFGREVVDAALRRGVDSLRALGVRIALDDFGTSPADDQMLRFVAPDFAKVDGALIRGARQPGDLRRRVAALVSRTTASGATPIAEGLEVEADAVAVAELGIPLAQGHLLGRPVGLETLALAVPEEAR